MNGYFVTGSDTGVGKTLVACALLQLLTRRSVDAVGMKPVAAGAAADGRNADVEALLAAGSAPAGQPLRLRRAGRAAPSDRHRQAANLALARRFRLTPCSAACIAKAR